MARLPTFQIVDSGGRRLRVSGALATTTVGELARCAGIAGEVITQRGIVVDGRPVATNETLLRAGLRHGSRIGVSEHHRPLASGVREAVWVGGPDAGGRFALGAGRHYVGRSRRADVHCADPLLELHHVVLNIATDGSLVIQQIAGARDVIAQSAAVCGPTLFDDDTRIEIGASVLLVRRLPSDGQLPPAPVEIRPAAQGSALDPLRSAHVRGPRVLRSFEPMRIAAPRHHDRAAGIVGAIWPTLFALAGAAGLALAFGQIMFLLFGLMGALVAVGTWLAQRVGLIRSRSRSAAEATAGIAAFGAALSAQRAAARESMAANVPTLAGSIAMITVRSPALWAVRACDADAFTVSVGEGESFWQPVVDGLGDAAPELWGLVETSARLGIVPIPASLTAGSIVAIVGDSDAAPVARAMILQLAAVSGPADWRLAVISDRAQEWRGLDWLGHVIDSSGCAQRTDHAGADALIAALDPEDRRHLVILLDGPEPLHSRTSALRRLMTRLPSVACIVVCPSSAQVPAVCTSMLVVGSRGSARWTPDASADALAESVHVAGIAAAHADDVARMLAELTDPEHVDDNAQLPAAVGLAELLRGELGDDPSRFAHTIADRWFSSGCDPAPRSPVGRAVDGIVEVDLVRDGPHALLAGTTGAGKSELLRSLVLGMAVRSSPDHLCFVLVDYKGGATFDDLAQLPHVVGLVTDLDDRLASRALCSLEAEIRRRERMLRDAGVSDLAGYRAALDAGRVTGALPRLAVVIDEFAGLTVQQPDFMGALLGIAQRGRSLGMHLVLATQRPAGVIGDDIRANTQLRIALRVQDATDSIDVLGDAGASRLPRRLPGRAIMRLGDDEMVTFQTARCTEPLAARSETTGMFVRPADEDPGAIDSAQDVCGVPTELEVLVGAVRRAAQLTGVKSPHRPWLAPLAPGMDASALSDAGVGSDPQHAIGVVDDPASQCRQVLAYPSSGHLLIAGSVGTGTTTALLAVAAALERDDVQLFVVDGIGDPRLDALGGSCLIRLHEHERLLRLLDRLVGIIDHRAAVDDLQSHDARSQVILMIDGYGALRSAFERDDDWPRLEQLDHILANGAACGVRVVLTASRPGFVPAAALAQIAHRWVFHLAEVMDVVSLGVDVRAAVPSGVPGRMVIASSGLEAQVFAPTSPTAVAVATARVDRGEPISELPRHVRLDALPAAVLGGHDLLAPIGVGFDSLGPVLLPIAAGEHVLVVGPARSGRSTAVLTIAECWRRARPEGEVVCITPRRSSARVGRMCRDVDELIDTMPGGRAVLIVIDDAEQVEDPRGRLAALVGSRADDVTVIAAGRPESLRACFGHWTAAVRRSRLGLVMSGGGELDADLLGAVLPRRLPLRARPGLAWLVAEGGHQLLQVAEPPAAADPGPSPTSLDAIGVVP